MNFTTFHQLVKNPEIIIQQHIDELNKLCDKYPYFTLGFFLFIKSLQNYNNILSEEILPKVAVRAPDRGKLYFFLNGDNTSSILNQQKNNRKLKPTNQKQTQELKTFTEWLCLKNIKPIDRTESQAEIFKRKKANLLIDRFIKEQPKIGSAIPVSSQDERVTKTTYTTSVNHSDLMTETLAKLYLEQKNYVKAIKAYEILSLKYPKKSGFFADRIKEINNLKKE